MTQENLEDKAFTPIRNDPVLTTSFSGKINSLHKRTLGSKGLRSVGLTNSSKHSLSIRSSMFNASSPQAALSNIAKVEDIRGDRMGILPSVSKGTTPSSRYQPVVSTHTQTSRYGTTFQISLSRQESECVPSLLLEQTPSSRGDNESYRIDTIKDYLEMAKKDPNFKKYLEEQDRLYEKREAERQLMDNPALMRHRQHAILFS